MTKHYTMKAEAGEFKSKSVDAGIEIKRGEKSWALFALAYNISLTISIGLIAVISDDIINWQLKFILIIWMSYFLYRCCFYRFRNKIVGIFMKSQEHIEKR